MISASGIIGEARAPGALRDASNVYVELTRGWDQTRERLRDDIMHGQMTPFQHRHWLDAWYGAQQFGAETAPLIAIVRRQHRVLAILPLIVIRSRGLRIAESAGGADYNAPILGAAAADGPIDPGLFWNALRDALAEASDCDLVRFRKMPTTIGKFPNPLASLPETVPCALRGHRLLLDDDYEAYRLSRERRYRKELERSWRVFTKHDDARFERITELDRAMDVFATLESQQKERMRELGHDYILDDEASSTFHRDLIRRGIVDGYVVLTALTCGDTIVATLLGLRTDSNYLMLRISNAGEVWANCSPGRLIIERTMMYLHADGVRSFDFSVGTYDYKRRFGVEDVPLRDLTAAISWRGRAVVAAGHAARSLARLATAIKLRK
jgi:CelD/BcsL family acetyltransferase involved in cellulose biosynthesis